MEKCNVLGLSIVKGDSETVAKEAMALYKAKGKCMIYTPNAQIGEHARKNHTFRQILQSADILVADGVGVVLAGRILGKKGLVRAPGIEVGEELLKEAGKERLSVFFLGGAKGIAEMAASRMLEKHQGWQLAGCCDGYLTDKELHEGLKEANFDLLFVCLGSPRQEIFIAGLPEKNSVIAIGLGGSFDVWSGNKKRSPRWIQKSHLEWFWRGVREPKRIKGWFSMVSYLFSAIGVSFSYKIKGRKAKESGHI